MTGAVVRGASARLSIGLANCEARSVKQLGVVPKGFPLAPENEEFSEEIRQMVVGRYRVLFTIKSRNVHVLHVRGAYVDR